MRKLLLLSLLGLACSATAQTSKFKYGWDIWCEYQQNNLQQTSDGGYIICTDAVPEMDTVNHLAWCYLIKLNQLGQTMWIKRFAKSNYFIKAYDGNSVCQTSDGGYAIATVMYTGASSSTSSHTAIYIVRTDANGNYLWSKTYPGVGNSSASCIYPTADHGFIVAGNSTDTMSNVGHGYLLRTDSVGNVLWGKWYVAGSGGRLYSASETSDGGFIACGEVNGSIILKTDSAGNVLWSMGGTGLGSDAMYDVQETSDGSFITCGYNATSFLGPTLEKFSSGGSPDWALTYQSSTTSTDYAWSVEETWDGYSIAEGPMGGGNNLSVMHTDTAGQPLWARNYYNVYAMMPIDLEHTTDGGYAMCTSWLDLSSSTWNWKMVLIKTDSMGVTLCSDSLIDDTATALQLAVPITLTVTNAVPSAPFSTIIYPVMMPDSNFCDSHIPDLIGENSSAVTIDLFPNPVNSELNVSITGCNNDPVELHLYNSLGQEMINQREQATGNAWNTTLSVGHLAEGIYFLVVEVNGVKVDARKIMVE